MKCVSSLIVAALLLFSAGGCQVVPSSVTATQLTADITGSATQIQAATGVATQVALLSVSTADRPAATVEVHNVALAVQQALNQSNPSFAEAQKLVLAAIQKNGGKYADIETVAFSAGSNLVTAELQRFYGNVSTNQQAQAGIAFLQAVANGVVNATAPTTPAPAPSATPTSAVWIPASSRLPSPYEVLRQF